MQQKLLTRMPVVVLFFGFLLPLWAQTGSRVQKQGVAVFVEQGPEVDGVLDDPVWAQSAPLSDFQQKDPQEGSPSSEYTAVRIVYTKKAIYFGFRCDDSRPAEIIATERRRDQDLTKDDSVAVILDTFHDSRNAFLFRTNALGTQFDGLLTEEGLDINISWDEKWEAEANRSEEGWTAELMIPFKSLRMGAQGEWGLEVERLIRRKNEAVYWNTYNRDFKFEDVSQAGLLSGLEEATQGLRWRIKPFGLGGFEQFPNPAGGAVTHNLSDIGLELLKYRPTPALTLDVTVNTDFAQTEVDDVITNVTRFPLFFPERREFFLEGAGIFEFGTGLGIRQSRDFKLFFSRRIGLSRQGNLIPIIAGAKFTGRVGPYTLGVINMQTDTDRAIQGSNFGVFRVKRDLLERSSIGAMFTNRQSSQEEDYNRVFGIDGNFVFADNLNIQAFLAKTETPALRQDDWAGFGRVLWNSDSLLLGAEYLVVQRNFNPEIGFVPRRDQRKTTLQFGLKPRPESDLIRQWVLRTRMDYTQNQDGKQESMQYHIFTSEMFFEAGDRLMVDLHQRFERLFQPFRIRPDITIPTGTYRGGDILVLVDGAPQRKIAGREILRFEYRWGFFEGSKIELRLEPQIKVSEALSFDVGYALQEVDLPQGDFTSQVINTRVNYSVSNQLLTSATVQYSSLDDFVNFRFRINYIYRPGDDIFFIYNEGRNIDEFNSGLVGRSIMVKWTYSLDF